MGPIEANLVRDLLATREELSRTMARVVRAIERARKADATAPTRVVAHAAKLRAAGLARDAFPLPALPDLPGVPFAADDPEWVAVAKGNMTGRIWVRRVAPHVRSFERWMDLNLPGDGEGQVR